MYKGTIVNGYDIGVLILRKGFQLDKNVQLAKLPPLGPACPLGAMLIASGWGLERRGDNIGSLVTTSIFRHQYLWAVNQECFDVSVCTRYTGDKGAIICAGGSNDNRDTICIGDSGGNLLRVNFKHNCKLSNTQA